MHIIKSLTANAATVLRLQNPCLYHYQATTQKRYNQKQSGMQKDTDQYMKQIMTQQIDPSYWDSILPKIEAPAAKLVTMILNAKSSPKQINRDLQQYLQFRNTTFSQNTRTDLGCAAVLVALKNCLKTDKNQEFEYRIVDFVTLSDIKQSDFDSTMLRHLMVAISKRVNMNIQKNIRQYYRMKLVEILMDNFERIDNKDLLLLLKIIDECIQKDRTNFITKWRFYPLAQSLIQRLFSLMQSYISTNDYQIRKLIETIVSPNFYFKIMQLVSYYDYMTQKDAKMLYKFMTTYDSKHYMDYSNAFNLFNTLCYIPCVEMQEGSGVTTVRKLMLGFIQANFSDYSTLRKSWDRFYPHAKRFTLQRFFEDEFHSVFKSLPFQKNQDKYLLLRKQDLVKPEIPQFVWQLFKQNQKLFLEKYILSHMITNIYPDQVSLPKSQWPVLQKRNATWTAQNEANLKIWQALQNIGYDYKKQQLCAGRQVDILINNQIALELDGEGHYMFLTNEMIPETSTRNLQLLLSGYKLVVISMFEYNNNRKLEELENLLREKIDLVAKHGYVYVC